jgi:D-lactate dehydrogenase (cytochrome)
VPGKQFDTPDGDRVPVDTDPAVLQSFLSDAAHVPGGFAFGVVFPRSTAAVAACLEDARSVLPIGAQSSLTGGATPRGELVLSTRHLTDITIDRDRLTVRAGAGVPLHALQQALSAEGLWYPPAPTYDGAFVGGTVATNAAGAATFKYGTTRAWVTGLTVVLADGTVLPLARGDIAAAGLDLHCETRSGRLAIRVPGYRMPDVPKLSAGYFASRDMDLVDLFVGCEGTLGVLVDVTLRVVKQPRRCVVLMTCRGDDQAVELTRLLREETVQAWQGAGALDVAAIEYMDAESLSFLPDRTFSKVGAGRPPAGAALLLVQMEVGAGVDAVLDRLTHLTEEVDAQSDPFVALPGDDAGAARLFELREAVPAAVNAAIGEARRADPAVQKTAGDFIVPFRHLGSSIALYRRVCADRGLRCAIWGHASDGNLHPNIVARSADEVLRGREALIEAAREVMAVGGAPLAEHGVGRSPMKQQFLREMYGSGGVAEMRAVKQTLDPGWKLSPGVLFER